MGVTIKDIAKLANVAPSTVSRVIADHPSISQKTKDRVRALIEEMGYQPNYQAQSLGRNTTNTLGIVMPDSTNRVFQNPFFPEIIRGISNIAHDKSYEILISTGTTEQEIMESIKRMVQQRRVDGFILLYSKIDDQVSDYLRSKKFPFVIVGKPYKNIDATTHVDNDNIQAAKETVDYLVKKGHQQIAFVGGDPTQIVTIDRMKGYKLALQEANIPLREELIIREKSLREGGREAARELMKLDNKPTALIVTDDLIALGILTSFAQNNVKVPDDVSIISFNNVLIADMAHPALTSVDIQVFKLGYYAGDCLIEKIKNPDEPHKRVIVPFKLVERESCK